MKVNLLTSWHFWTLPASFRVKAVVGQIWILKLTRWIWVVFLFNVSFLCLFLGLWSLWSGLFELGFLWIEVEIYSFTSFSFTGFEKKHFSLEMVTKLIKGQIKSEWIYEITNFPKNYPKNLKDFCPMYCKNLRAEILQIFGVIFWKLMIS